jgi:nuclear protein localization family protein 4
MNEYKLAVQENAKPAFPIEYLLVTLTHGFPDDARPLFTSDAGKFPIENRMHVGVNQDLHAVMRQLGLNSDDTSLDAISDFHLLVYLFSLGVLSPEDEKLVVKVALEHNVQDGYNLLQSPGWQTLLTIIREST